MMMNSYTWVLFVLMFVSGVVVQVKASYYSCNTVGTRCHGRSLACPSECPYTYSHDPRAKVCYVNCNSPHCKPECKHRKPNCNGPGAVCYDPRFIGGDGIVFYFHGKSNEHFSLVSDRNLQINARFTGHRPAGRSRDFTWIQALGVLFDSHTFSVEAAKAATWDDEIDRLKFTYNGERIVIPEGPLAVWNPQDQSMKVERISTRNSVVVSVPNVVEISVNVVPVTKEDDRVHNYRVPSDDCFTHLEVQFRFHGLSGNVSGVLGRTYQPNFESPAKQGVAMPVVGGEDEYRTTSLVSSDCRTCVYNPGNTEQKTRSSEQNVRFHVGTVRQNSSNHTCTTWGKRLPLMMHFALSSSQNTLQLVTLRHVGLLDMAS